MESPLKAQQVEVSQDALRTGAFRFSDKAEDQAHLFFILRDQMYSDRVLAVVREYTSNAWDAHREAGIPDQPIRVYAPTEFGQAFVVRDYGFGLSEEDIYNVFVTYGASTKRNTNDQTGMLGIGAKAGFAYSDSFTVTSYHKGTKATYVASLDKSNIGVMVKLFEEPTTESGLEVSIPVATKDMPAFIDKMELILSYMTPRPESNIRLEPFDKHEARISAEGVRAFLTSAVSSRYHGWVARVGVVPYRLNLIKMLEEMKTVSEKDLQREERRLHGVIDRLNQYSGCIDFAIGEVDVTASREELRYSPKTIRAVLWKFLAFHAAYVGNYEAEFYAQPNGYHRRLYAQSLKNDLELFFHSPTKQDLATRLQQLALTTIPFLTFHQERVNDTTANSPGYLIKVIDVPDQPFFLGTFRGGRERVREADGVVRTRLGPNSRHLSISDSYKSDPKLLLFIDNEEMFKTLRAVRPGVQSHFAYNSTFIIPHDMSKVAEAWDALQAHLLAHELDGLPITKLSDCRAELDLAWAEHNALGRGAPEETAEERAARMAEEERRDAREQARARRLAVVNEYRAQVVVPRRNETFWTTGNGCSGSTNWRRVDISELPENTRFPYVVLEKFRPVDAVTAQRARFLNTFQIDSLRELATTREVLGIKVQDYPTVYGFRQTKKITPSLDKIASLGGVPLDRWVEEEMTRVLTENEPQFREAAMYNLWKTNGYPKLVDDDRYLRTLQIRLGTGHPVIDILLQVCQARINMTALLRDHAGLCNKYNRIYAWGRALRPSWSQKFEYRFGHEKIMKEYPLLLTLLHHGSQVHHVADYVLGLDLLKRRSFPKDETTILANAEVLVYPGSTTPDSNEETYNEE